MSSFQLNPLIPRACALYKVSKTPTITFRLDTTPEFCTRGTRHFLRTHPNGTEAAARCARRANHTTRRTPACRSRRIRADTAQNHAPATRNKCTVATAVHVAVQSSCRRARAGGHPVRSAPAPHRVCHACRAASQERARDQVVGRPRRDEHIDPQARSTAPPQDFSATKNGWPLRPHRHRKRRCACSRMPLPIPALESAHTQRVRESCQLRLCGEQSRERSHAAKKAQQPQKRWHTCR